MEITKAILSLILVLFITFCIAGCSYDFYSFDNSLKDNLLDGWNDWMQDVSKGTLTGEKDLQGERQIGEDYYTGTYTADYEGFSGKEIIFSGTGLKREMGNTINVTYTLTIEEGAADLYRIAGNDQILIADSSSENVMEYTISTGDNYIVLKGEDFTGSLALTVI